MRIRTIGETSISLGSNQVGPDSAVLFGALLFISLHAGRPVARDRIREIFWPDADEPSALHSLRQLLYRMRRLGAPISTTPNVVTLDLRSVSADFAPFIKDWPQPVAIELCDSLGEFLNGYHPEFSSSFATWIEEQRGVIHGSMRNAMLIALAQKRAKGDWRSVADLSRGILRIDPLNEEATLSLAEATALAGSKAEAVAMLDKYLQDIGPDRLRSIAVPPTVLRQRIAERELSRGVTRSATGAFVGRNDSVAFLHGCLQETIAGRGKSSFVWGPAGIGKTRLTEEFLRNVPVLGAKSVRITCQSADRTRPMSVFSELAQRLLGLPGALGSSPESYSLLRRLCTPDLSSDTVSLAATDAHTLFGRIRGALYDILDAVSTERCLLIVVDDFHWSDEQSVAVLTDIVNWAQTRRLSFLLTSRYKRPPKAVIATYGLEPLDASDVRLLSKSLVPGDARVKHDTLERWVQHSQGNPLYVHEIVAHWQITGGADSMPPSLSALLTHRLQNLSDTSRSTIQAIAVLGRNCTHGRLLNVTQSPRHALVRALDELQCEHLIKDDGLSLICSHEMIAQAATAALSPLALKMLHRISALELEASAALDADAQTLWDCARHWEAAGDPDRGLRLTLKCSHQLLELGLPHEAAAMLTAARPLARSVSSAIDLLGGLAKALQHAGRWNELHGVLVERNLLRPTMASSHDEWELLLAEAAWRGHHRDPLTILSNAIRCAATSDAAPAHRIRAAGQGLRIAAECCDRERGKSLYQAINELSRDDHDDPALAAEIETVYHTSFGDLDAGARAAKDLIDITRTRHNPVEIARALRFASLPYRLIGRCTEAEAALLESREISRRHALRSAEMQALYRLGVHYLAVRQPDAALRWWSEFSVLGSSDDDRFGRASAHLLAAEAHIAIGDVRGAKSIYEQIADFRVPGGLIRAANGFAAVGIRLRLGESPPDVANSEIVELHRLHLLARGMGAEDFSSATLFRAMVELGETSAALALFHEYIATHRRDRIPFEIELADFQRRFVDISEVNET